MYTVCKMIKNYIFKMKNIRLSSLGCVQWPDGNGVAAQHQLHNISYNINISVDAINVILSVFLDFDGRFLCPGMLCTWYRFGKPRSNLDIVR